VIDQIDPYTAWWDQRNQANATADGPLLAVIGDSTALGIGADGPDRSYASLVHRCLEQRHHRPWRIINLALSGARVADALDRQLPVVERLDADVVLCCVGTNDLVWGSDTTRLREQLRTLVASVPDRTVLGSLAGVSIRAQLANRALRNAAAERGVPLVDPWGEPGPSARARLASDRFHPNDLGYRLMARPFCRHLGLPVDDPDADDPDAAEPGSGGAGARPHPGSAPGHDRTEAGGSADDPGPGPTR
jgi:lysophospholipase L1-like esterase